MTWGRVVDIDAHEDPQALAENRARQTALGVTEATAPQITRDARLLATMDDRFRPVLPRAQPLLSRRRCRKWTIGVPPHSLTHVGCASA